MNSLCNKTKALIAITERYEPSQLHTHRAGIMTCHTFAINSAHDLKYKIIWICRIQNLGHCHPTLVLLGWQVVSFNLVKVYGVYGPWVIFAELYPRILVLSQSLVHCARNCIVSMSMFV